MKILLVLVLALVLGLNASAQLPVNPYEGIQIGPWLMIQVPAAQLLYPGTAPKVLGAGTAGKAAAAQSAGAKASFIAAQPVVYTNSLAWNDGVGISNRAAWLQSSPQPAGKFTNLVSFPMDGQDRTNTFTSTNRQFFFRLKWNSGDLAK